MGLTRFSKQLLILTLFAVQAQGAISFLTTGTLGSSGNAITVGQPGSPAVNDIWIMVVQSANQAITTPTNATAGTWAEIATQLGSGTAAAAGSTRLGFYWMRWTTTTGNITLADTGDHQLVRIAAYRGVKTTGNPWNAVSVMVSATWTAAGGNITSNATTTTVNNCWILTAVAHSEDIADIGRVSANGSNGGVTAQAERFDNTLSTGTGGGIALQDGLMATAGSFTGSQGLLMSLSIDPTPYIKCTVALEPEPAPTQSATNQFFIWFMNVMTPWFLWRT